MQQVLCGSDRNTALRSVLETMVLPTLFFSLIACFTPQLCSAGHSKWFSWLSKALWTDAVAWVYGLPLKDMLLLWVKFLFPSPFLNIASVQDTTYSFNCLTQNCTEKAPMFSKKTSLLSYQRIPGRGQKTLCPFNIGTNSERGSQPHFINCWITESAPMSGSLLKCQKLH